MCEGWTDGCYHRLQDLVQANPIPRGWQEVFLDGVGQTCTLVCAPRSHRRNVHVRCVETLPQLWEKGREGGRFSMPALVSAVSYRSPPGWRTPPRACGHWLRSSCHWCICLVWPGADTRPVHLQQRSMLSHCRRPCSLLEGALWVWCATGFGRSRLVFFSSRWVQQRIICVLNSK